MDATKIVNKIKDDAKTQARAVGHDEYAFALGVVGVWLEMAIEAIDRRDTQWFYQRMREIEREA